MLRKRFCLHQTSQIKLRTNHDHTNNNNWLNNCFYYNKMDSATYSKSDGKCLCRTPGMLKRERTRTARALVAAAVSTTVNTLSVRRS
jgi:hypothetical protein